MNERSLYVVTLLSETFRYKEMGNERRRVTERKEQRKYIEEKK
jgi:hypothetical protein